MFTLCCSDTKWKAGSNCEKTADTKQCAAVGSYGRACARLNAFQFACARLCGESGTSRTFVTMEQRWWGCRGPMLENTRLCTRRYKHPPSPKKHQSNSNRGSPNTPPPFHPNARQPGQHHRGGWCSYRHVVERAPGSEIRAQHLIHAGDTPTHDWHGTRTTANITKTIITADEFPQTAHINR